MLQQLNLNALLGPYVVSASTAKWIEAAQHLHLPFLSTGPMSMKQPTYSYIYSILPSPRYFFSSGARDFVANTSLVIVYDDTPFARDACRGLSHYVAEYVLPFNGSAFTSSMDEIVFTNFTTQRIDAVASCLYGERRCTEWNRAMHRHGLNAVQFFAPICDASFEQNDLNSFYNEFSHVFNLDYIVGDEESWDSLLQMTRRSFEERLFMKPSLSSLSLSNRYAVASITSALSIIVQAFDKGEVGDMNISSFISSFSYETFLGNITFNETTGERMIGAYPPLNHDDDDEENPNFEAWKTWEQRECLQLSSCQSSGGMCLNDDGSCHCFNEHTYYLESNHLYGRNASCIPSNPERNLIEDRVLVVGSIYIALQTIASVGAIGWTAYHRNTQLLRLSQPVFLVMIAFGCFVITCSIIPMGIQDNDNTYLGDEEEYNSDVVDAACASVSYFYGIGFIIVFSALIAKIHRVRLLVGVGVDGLRRRKVQASDMFVFILLLICMETILIVVWQFVAEPKWERVPIAWDMNGNVISSIGRCRMRQIAPDGYKYPANIDFHICTFFHTCCILYALWQGYMSWSTLPTELAEGIWIFASILSFGQGIILAVPILYLAHEDHANNTFYFARTTLCFLQSFTVVCFMFLPKAYRLHKFGDVNVAEVVAETISTSGSNGNRLSMSFPSIWRTSN